MTDSRAAKHYGAAYAAVAGAGRARWPSSAASRWRITGNQTKARNGTSCTRWSAELRVWERLPGQAGSREVTGLQAAVEEASLGKASG